MKNSKIYSILSTLVIVGIALSWYASQLTPTSWQQTWLMQLATAILISGGLGIVDKVISKKDDISLLRETLQESLMGEPYLIKLKELITIKEWTNKLCVTHASLEAQEIDYSDMIEDDPFFALVGNDARTWVSSRISSFQKRFTKKDFVTEIFITDPDGVAVAAVAKKTGYSLEAQKSKIYESKNRLLEEWRRAGGHGQLIFYHIPYYVTHSAFLSSKKAFFTLYGISSGRRTTPVFECMKNEGKFGLYQEIASDINDLRRESKVSKH
jgi:hypothetical protein